jgi:hypothetical protein
MNRTNQHKFNTLAPEVNDDSHLLDDEKIEQINRELQSISTAGSSPQPNNIKGVSP